MEQARPSVGPAAARPTISAPNADDEASELASEPRSRPDGDVDVAADAYAGFVHPECEACGGIWLDIEVPEESDGDAIELEVVAFFKKFRPPAGSARSARP